MGQQQQNNYNKMDDIDFVDAEDPDSSIGHHHVDEIIAPASNGQMDDVIPPPDDNEANFGQNNGGIPAEIEEKLEESLSVDENMEFAPPPPSEPIPDDILLQHAKSQNNNGRLGRALSL